MRRRNPSNFLIFALFFLLILGVYAFFQVNAANKIDKLNYSQFETYYLNDQVNTMVSKPSGYDNPNHYQVKGTYTLIGSDNTSTTRSYEVIVREAELTYLISIINTDIDGDGIVDINTSYTASTIVYSWILSLIMNIIPYVIIGGISIFLFMKFMKNNANNAAMRFGDNKAKLTNSKSKTFKDVAGCDEEKEELIEIVDFLKNPKKYVDMGARIPKGVLLSGPPGTGKTLLAKAVAGEAEVPFFTISGSDFVEMFVGVGASRVRNLFKEAKENAPCIIFIDEIDAVGRQRGTGMGGGNDEREQTLNQLLVEMDGFSANLGIIIMAATNRPDVLDPALLRPGRFDRSIIINTPDLKGRTEILAVHAKNKKLNPSISFEDVAQRIPGFSGADIENLLNEAALLAARDNRTVVEIHDIDEAVDRVMMGPAKKSKRFTERERKTVAHHEAGHAVIGLKLENSNVVQKVTIIPRGNAGGYALMLPEEETFLETRTSLLDRITGYLGGRVAEEIMFNEVSTGAHNDFKQATAIARAMVTEYGMSGLGPVQYETGNGSVFLGRDYLKDKSFSDKLAHEIDVEVRSIIEGCYENCKKVLLENKTLLETIADYLLKIETLTKQDILEIESTGTIKWYEEKQAQKELEKKNETPVVNETTGETTSE